MRLAPPSTSWLALAGVVAPLALGPGCSRGAATPATCEAVGGHVLALFEPADAYAKDLAAAFATRCREDTWSVEARACLLATKVISAPRNCRATLTPDQAGKLDAAVADADKRQEARRRPAECVRYQLLLDRLAGCDRVSADLRETLRQNWAALQQRWAAEGIGGVDGVCASALVAIKPAVADCPGAETW